MNHQGGPYLVANSDSFDTEYADDRKFFEIYSHPIKTLYSEVHWRAHSNIPLPKHIIKEFEDGKIMAITGYEVDQVFANESNVPISWAYNHHYGAFLSNSRKATMRRKPVSDIEREHGLGHGSLHHWGADMKPSSGSSEDNDDEIPQVQFFSEGNGGEMRMSYHGYPRGYAQLIESPDMFSVVPMQIDTWNRAGMTNATYVPGAPRPRSSPNTIPQQSAPYNALLECPCSNRIEKEWDMTYQVLVSSSEEKGVCPDGTAVHNATECFSAASKVWGRPVSQRDQEPQHNPQWPLGCSMIVQPDATTRAIWNPAPIQVIETKGPVGIGNERDSHRKANHQGSTTYLSFVSGAANVTVQILSGDIAEITLEGPADAWFGVGFGSSSMCVQGYADECPGSGPYSIIVQGDELVEERRLAFHGPGRVLPSFVKVLSNTVDHETDQRTVVLQRPLQGPNKDYYSFLHPSSTLPAALNVPVIIARGCSLTFEQHCGHGPATLTFLPTKTPSQICQAGVQGTVGGDDFDNNRCLPFPGSTLSTQKNPTCAVQTYTGGLSCCRDGTSLLDNEQEQPWPDQILEYRLKFRFYYQDFDNGHEQVGGSQDDQLRTPSHKSLIRLYHQTEAWAGEYDIPQCATGTPPEQCIHVITARWKVREMMADCAMHDATICTGKGSPYATGIELIYAGPHCHAGTCISMELYNADTGELLCQVQPILGQNSSKPYQEEEYIAIPPCLWGEEDGLVSPRLLTMDTTLLSIKRSNSTYPHTGEMASWQMRGILMREDEELSDASVSSEGMEAQRRPLLRTARKAHL